MPPNRTIGREHDVAAVGERLRAGSVRLLTLTGPGGVGKTRLALEAARAVEADFADGAHFVSLAALHRPEDVPAAIVNALGIIVLSGESADQAAERFLAAKHLLLVADNLEHLLAAAPFIGGLLEACPALTVLATSREPLALQAEERYPVSPLALPERRDARSPTRTPSRCSASAREPTTRLRPRRRQRRRGRGDLPARRRAAAGDRARGRPLRTAVARPRSPSASTPRSAPRAPAPATRPRASRRCARRSTGATTCSATPSSGASRASPCSPAARPWRRPRRSPAPASTRSTAGRQEPARARAGTAHAPTRLGMLETIRAYADGALRRRRRRRAPSASATTATTSRSPSATGPNARSGAPAAPEHLARLDAEIDNLARSPRLGGRSGATPSARSRWSAALGWYWLMRDRYADAVNWIDQALSLPGADAHPALRVRAAPHEGQGACGRWGAEPSSRRSSPSAGGHRPTARRPRDPLPGPPDAAPITRSTSSGSMSRTPSPTRRFAGPGPPATTGRSPRRRARRRSRRPASPSCASASTRPPRCSSEVGNVYQLADLLTAAAYAALCLGSERDATDFAARAAPIARALDSPFDRMINSGNLGLAALLDRRDRRRRRTRSARSSRSAATWSSGRWRSKASAAWPPSPCVDGDDERAATLVGAADAHRYEQPEDAVEARLDDDVLRARPHTAAGPTPGTPPRAKAAR